MPRSAKPATPSAPPSTPAPRVRHRDRRAERRRAETRDDQGASGFTWRTVLAVALPLVVVGLYVWTSERSTRELRRANNLLDDLRVRADAPRNPAPLAPEAPKPVTPAPASDA